MLQVKNRTSSRHSNGNLQMTHDNPCTVLTDILHLLNLLHWHIMDAMCQNIDAEFKYYECIGSNTALIRRLTLRKQFSII